VAGSFETVGAPFNIHGAVSAAHPDRLSPLCSASLVAARFRQRGGLCCVIACASVSQRQPHHFGLMILESTVCMAFAVLCAASHIHAWRLGVSALVRTRLLLLQDVRVRGPGPELGVDTTTVLKERLSLTDDQVAELKNAGAIGAKPVPGSPYANWAARL
jgi:hypothetical protein